MVLPGETVPSGVIRRCRYRRNRGSAVSSQLRVQALLEPDTQGNATAGYARLQYFNISL